MGEWSLDGQAIPRGCVRAGPERDTVRVDLEKACELFGRVPETLEVEVVLRAS